jgi:uncharacterized protein (DUF1501 family)
MVDYGYDPVNTEGGRDHRGAAGSVLFAGGGMRGGQVIGATDKSGAHPTTTVLHDRQGRSILLLPAGEPIPGLL